MMKQLRRTALLALAGLATGCAQLRYARNQDGVSIRFSNGVRLNIEIRDGNLTGLTQVSVRGRNLRAPGFPAHPVFKTNAETGHASCSLESVDRDGERLVLRCRLTPKNGTGEDTFSWIFEPRTEKIRGREYVGFAYRYEFQSPVRKLEGILDLATWEVGGDINGKFVQPGRRARKEESFRTSRSWAFATTPWFRFQCGSDGMLYDVYENVCPVISWAEKRAGSGLLRTFDLVQQEHRREGGTPFRKIMFCGSRGSEGLACVDEYTKVFDHLEREARAEFGIADPEYIPVCKAPQRSDETFEQRLEELEEIAELGFKGMWMCVFESVTSKLRKRPMVNASIYSIDPAEILGGTAGLGKLAEAARRHDIRIYAWAPGGQLRPESEVLKANPDWLLHVPEGMRRRLPGSTDLHSGYHDYAIGKYRELHETTGIDSFWFDSFNAAAKGLQVRQDGARYFQVRKAFQMVADTQKAGIGNVQLEGAGPSGQYALTSGYLGAPDPLCYKRAVYVSTARPEKINYYYRWIANKAFPMVPVRYVNWTYEYKALDQFPQLREQVRRANLDWAAVQDLMVHRHLIPAADDPWKDVGVEWTKPGNPARALFAYGEFDYSLSPGAQVMDVTEGKAVACSDQLRTKCCHTYRIE